MIVDLCAPRDEWRTLLAGIEAALGVPHETLVEDLRRELPQREPEPLPTVQRQDDAVRQLRILDAAEHLRELAARARGIRRWMRAVV